MQFENNKSNLHLLDAHLPSGTVLDTGVNVLLFNLPGNPVDLDHDLLMRDTQLTIQLSLGVSLDSIVPLAERLWCVIFRFDFFICKMRIKIGPNL